VLYTLTRVQPPGWQVIAVELTPICCVKWRGRVINFPLYSSVARYHSSKLRQRILYHSGMKQSESRLNDSDRQEKHDGE
jgi:hypothetical protein